MTLLRDCWYLVLSSRRLKRGRLAAKIVMGGPGVIGRRVDAHDFAHVAQAVTQQPCQHSSGLSCGSGVCAA